MTVFRVSAISLFLGLLAPLAGAQTPATSNDAPPVLTDEDMPPVADAPDKPVPPQPDAPPIAATLPPADKAVVVDSLGTSEGPAIGLLNSTNGGLGESLWSGTSRVDAEELLTRIPLASADPVLRALAKRLVLTKADAPIGPSKRAFVTLRIEKLLDAGLIDEAGTLAAQASIPNDPEFARVQADALLIANRASDICSERTATRLTAAEPFWLQLRAYCAAAAGDTATADLTRAVLEAQGNGDKAYDALFNDVLGHKLIPPGHIAHPTAMHVFLLRQAGLPISGEVAAAMGTPANLLAMRDTRNSPQIRIEAADRIIRTGAASVAELKALAEAGDIPTDRLATALSDAPNLPFFVGQVLLRRAAQLETRPDAKAQLVFTALSLGEKTGLLPLAAGLQGDIAASIKPMPAKHDMAHLYARALLLAGMPDAAERWLSDRDAMRGAVDLVAPNAARDAKAQAIYAAYVAELTADPPMPDADGAYKALLLGLADVLGKSLPPDAKAHVPSLEAQHWAGKRPGTTQRLEAASLKPERKGEALLLILGVVQTNGLRDMAPDVTIELVRLLGEMNLPDTAHRLAVEALALYVPPPLPPAPAP